MITTSTVLDLEHIAKITSHSLAAHIQPRLEGTGRFDHHVNKVRISESDQFIDIAIHLSSTCLDFPEFNDSRFNHRVMHYEYFIARNTFEMKIFRKREIEEMMKFMNSPACADGIHVEDIGHGEMKEEHNPVVDEEEEHGG